MTAKPYPKRFCGLTYEELHLSNLDANPDFYYGEIPQNDLQSILTSNKAKEDVEDAISDWCDSRGNKYFRSYALDSRRSLGLKLLGDLEQKSLLDYGCGLGSLGVPALRNGAHVTFVDSCLMRLETALLRARQSGSENFRGFGCATWKSLSKEVCNFDFILINGVMEWIPSSVGARFDSVLGTQLAFLQDMKDRLANDGAIYLAIENRFALQYLLGYPEDHTNIPYLSLYSREKANTIHQQQKHADFTNWTWGLDEFYDRLPAIGLAIKKAFALFPDYRFPEMAVELNDRQGLRVGMDIEQHGDSKLKDIAVECFHEMNRLQHHVYSYAFILQKAS